jgi:hypothetical protein
VGFHAAEGGSNPSQKLASKATTTASQTRIPRTQPLTGTPAKLNGCVTVTVVMERRFDSSGESGPPCGVLSWLEQRDYKMPGDEDGQVWCKII